MVKVFLFDDGEKHWIAAADQQQAVLFYENDCTEGETDYTCREVVAEEMNKKIYWSDDSHNKLVTLNDLLKEIGTAWPAIVASTVN